MTPAATLHASAVCLGGRGVLIRGPSGAGKSTLAFDLIEESRRDGETADLVADDRVQVVRQGEALVARAVARLSGLIEVRGLGIVDIGGIEAARIALVIDLVAGPTPRMPEDADRWTVIEGLRLPRLAIGPAATRPARLVRLALKTVGF